PPGKCYRDAAVPVDRQPQPRGVARNPTPFGHFVDTTNSNPLGHIPAPDFQCSSKNEQPRTCVRGMSASRFYLMAQGAQSAVWACARVTRKSRRCTSGIVVECV